VYFGVGGYGDFGGGIGVDLSQNCDGVGFCGDFFLVFLIFFGGCGRVEVW